MGKVRVESSAKPRRPALTPEARENQIIADAYDLAEKQIREGTASSQVISHFLKMGSPKARLEKEKMELENELIRAKTKAIESGEEIRAMYEDAIRAMKEYNGRGGSDDDYSNVF